MTLAAAIDGRIIADVATNAGWSDFVQWVESLEDVPALRHLTEHGWFEDDLQELASDIEEAIANGEPTTDQASIANGIARILSDTPGDVIVISDGIGEGGEDEDG